MSVLEQEHRTPGAARVFWRFLAATVITLVTAFLSALLWLFGQAQYINDYCTTRASQPSEVVGGRPAYMSDPITVACEFDGYPTVYVTEFGPLLGALILAGTVIAFGTVAIRWARRFTPSDAA